MLQIINKVKSTVFIMSIIVLSLIAEGESISVRHSAYVNADSGTGRIVSSPDGTSLYIGSGNTLSRRGIFEFAIPSISGYVTNATFKVYISSESSPKDLYLRNIDADGDVTTTDYDTTVINPGGVIATNGTAAARYFEYNITDMLNIALAGNKEYFAIRLEIDPAAYTVAGEYWNAKGKTDTNPPSIDYSVVSKSGITGVLHSAYVNADSGAGRALNGYDLPDLYAGSSANLSRKGVYEFAVPSVGHVDKASFNVYIRSESSPKDLYLRRTSADGDVTKPDYDATILDAGGVIAANGTATARYFEYDITSMLNAALSENKNYFAVRLEIDPAAWSSADEMWRIQGKGYNKPPFIKYVASPTGTIILIQ